MLSKIDSCSSVALRENLGCLSVNVRKSGRRIHVHPGFFYTHLVHPEANREPHSIRIPPTRASGTLTPETFPIDEESPADITAPPVTPITNNTYKITEKEMRILLLRSSYLKITNLVQRRIKQRCWSKH